MQIQRMRREGSNSRKKRKDSNAEGKGGLREEGEAATDTRDMKDGRIRRWRRTRQSRAAGRKDNILTRLGYEEETRMRRAAEGGT